MFKGFRYFIFIVFTMFFVVPPLTAEDDLLCTHTNSPTTDNYLGFVQIKMTPLIIWKNSALSLLGEIGTRTFRGNGTLATVYDRHLVKFGGEYLGQKIHYNFTSGSQRRWVHQYAFGGRYEYLIGNCWLDSLYIDGSSSFADSTSLTSKQCESSTLKTLVQRHLAGSRYYNFEAGGQFIPWDCAKFLVGVGYNSIRYNRNLNCKNRNINGIGVDLGFNQLFCNNFSLDVSAQFRRPYTYAEALLDWSCDSYYGILTLGIFGGYVWGKNDLPNSSNAGVQMGFAFGPNRCCGISNCCTSSSYCNLRGYTPSNDCQELLAWVSRPAVYMPAVLVVAEERITKTSTPIPPCTAVTAVGTIPDITNYSTCGPNDPLIMDISSFFTGTAPISYSVVFVQEDPQSQDPTSITIDSAGILTVTFATYSNGQGTFTITATNSCGSAVQSFNVRYSCS